MDLSSLAVPTATVDLSGHYPVGLILVDASVGFTRVGAMSDPERMVPMVGRINQELRALSAALGDRLHVLCFLDSHEPDIPEPPYPPHGVRGTGEDELDPELTWVLDEARVTVIRKDCINGFVGAIDRHSGRNAFAEWVMDHGLRDLLVVGDCTDICVLDLVVTTLSARNHGLLTRMRPESDRADYVAAVTGLRVSVLSGACETYHAPGAHDRALAHAVGLWVMSARGAVIAERWTVEDQPSS